MTSGRQPRSRLSRVFFCGCALGGAAALYVLSVGPVARLYNSTQQPMLRQIMESTFEPGYAPLAWASERSETFRKVLWWYLDLWVDLDLNP